MDIVACFDSGFVMPTGVMMYSVCMNNKDVDIVFHLVVDESVSERDKKDLEENISTFKGKQVSFYRVDSRRFQNLPALSSQSHLTQAAYYRLVLSEILPQGLDKVLYLDGDIVVRKSLLPLWNTNLTGYAIAAAESVASGYMPYYNRLKYPPHLGYFCSGVLLVNLAYWRTHEVTKSFSTYMRDHSSDILCHDQDVLNVVFCNKKLMLPITYNLTHYFLLNKPFFNLERFEKQLLQARVDPVVVHYTGDKPWFYCRYHNPYESLFHKIKSKTIWKDVPIKDKRPLVLRLRHFISDMMRRMGMWTQ